MEYPKIRSNDSPFDTAGMFTLALRLVTGWTYFSAFWRRLILENKLDPEGPGYIGEKFNHFLPQALLIRPGIEYLVANDELLWWSMLLFTIVEAIVGFLFMLGLFTRLMSIGVFGLALGILLGAGWLGTTCLDEWQIGVLGVAAGFTIYLSGGGRYALDHYLAPNLKSSRQAALFSKLGSGSLNIGTKALRRLVLGGAVSIFLLTLGTNQYFHGGLWGKLHNLSVRPHVTITEAVLEGDQLSFTVFRDEGADVYGSFLIGIRLKDGRGNTLMERKASDLASMTPEQIKNSYVAKVKAGEHSLVLPLGARARLEFRDPKLPALNPGVYTIELSDISGLKWEAKVKRRSLPATANQNNNKTD